MFRLTLRFLLLLLPVLIQGKTKTWGNYDPSKLILLGNFREIKDGAWTSTYVDYKPPAGLNDTVRKITKIEVIDNLNNGLWSDIADGGIGEDFAKIKLKSGGKANPLDAAVKIYGQHA